MSRYKQSTIVIVLKFVSHALLGDASSPFDELGNIMKDGCAAIFVLFSKMLIEGYIILLTIDFCLMAIAIHLRIQR